MTFWQKNKIFPIIKTIVPILTLFVYLTYPNTSHAAIPLIVWGIVTVMGLVGAGGAAIHYGPGAIMSTALDATLIGLGKITATLMYLLSMASLAIYNLVIGLLDNLLAFTLSRDALYVNTIASSWALVRDFANLGLIFIILYISISTVLGLMGSNTYKILGKVILVGLLINFSLMFTQIIIDTSNIVATKILTQITGSEKEPSLAFKLTEALNVTEIYGQTPWETKAVNTDLNYALIMLGISIYLLLSAFVLATGAAMFLVRILKLTGIMIFSPLAFAAIILPKSQNLAEKWWGELLGNAFLAPAYLFMVYISLAVLVGVMPTTKTLSISGAVAVLTAGEGDVPSMMSTFFGIVLSFGLLTSASVIAAIMSSSTAKRGGELAGRAFGTAMGAGAATGRLVGGYAGQKLYESTAGSTSTGGKFANSLGNVMRKGTWDVRNAPVAGAAIEQAAGQAGVSTKEGLVFKDAKASAGGRLKEQTDAKAKEKAEEKERKDTVRKLEIANTKKELNNPSMSEADYAAASDADKKTYDENIQKKLKQLRPEEVSEMVGENMSDPKKQHLIRNLTDKRSIKAIEDKLDIPNREKFKDSIVSNKDRNKDGYKVFQEEVEEAKVEKELLEAEKEISEIKANTATGLSSSGKSMKDIVQNMSQKVIVKLKVDTVIEKEFAEQMDGAQISALIKADVLKTGAHRQAIKSAHDPLINPGANASGSKYVADSAARGLL